MVPAVEDSTLHLPRILCLPGGGSNAEIFRSQCRRLTLALLEFRLVFAEAPFSSQAGPDVLSTYKEWSPFKGWLRWLPHHASLKPVDAIAAIDESLDMAMSQDPGTGEWVAVIGFSQGAKLAASLLYRQQCFPEEYTCFKFGVLFAGRAPLISLVEEYMDGLPDAAQITDPSRFMRIDWGQRFRRFMYMGCWTQELTYIDSWGNFVKNSA